MSDNIILKTTPTDPIHFPATNQTHYCWYVALKKPFFVSSFCLMLFLSFIRQKYNEFVLCVRKNGGEETACREARQLAVSICPNDWVSLSCCLLTDY
jgi:hypothetical protein